MVISLPDDLTNPPLGFILLNHNRPQQFQRLIDRLNTMFQFPPIVCHHDFSQCALPTELFPPNVSFVRPHLRTAWGCFSLVEATMRAMEQMYAAPVNPGWFALLSGTDYPIKPAAQILADFRAATYDAAIQFELIRANDFKRHWQEVCYQRYYALNVTVPVMAGWRLARRRLAINHPLLTKPFLPFNKNFACYAGAQWFCANRRTAQHLLKFHKANLKLANHYRKIMAPDESYFQTILANAPQFKLHNDNFRYLDWSAGEAHPKTLRLEDLPKLQASTAHFARKFDVEQDSIVLDELDRLTA